MELNGDQRTVVLEALEEQRKAVLRQMASEHTTLTEADNLAAKYGKLLEAVNIIEEITHE